MFSGDDHWRRSFGHGQVIPTLPLLRRFDGRPRCVQSALRSGGKSVGWCTASCLPRLHLRKAMQDEQTVIGGEPVVTLEAAAQAALDDDLFALGPAERRDGFHQPSAGAGSVAHPSVVDVETVEAVGTMVAMMATGHSRADPLAAVAADEGVSLVGYRFGLRRQHLVATGGPGSGLLLAGVAALGALSVSGSAMGRQRKLLSAASVMSPTTIHRAGHHLSPGQADVTGTTDQPKQDCSVQCPPVSRSRFE